MAVRDQRPVALTNAVCIIEARYAKQQSSVIEGGLFAWFRASSKKPQSEAVRKFRAALFFVVVNFADYFLS